MSVRESDRSHDADVRDAMAALRRAAETARQIAIQTGTAIIVVKDAKRVRITAEELRKQQAAGQS
ncbi:hypothetical protein GC170_01750 [bacterium]|nr:hypothetical protein [bacterium]